MPDIKFQCPGGHTADGYHASSHGAERGLVVIQEWWGLNDQIRGVADRYAQAGFAAVAPDLYQGRVAGDADEAGHMMAGLDWAGASAEEVNGAIRYLKHQGMSRVAVTGFCMGGALTVIAGVTLELCDAAVCYYGIPPVELADPADMRVPFLGHFAEQDDWCTPAAVDAFEASLARSSAPFELHRYPAAHAFFNAEVSAYDAEAAELSWQRTMAFLHQHL